MSAACSRSFYYAMYWVAFWQCAETGGHNLASLFKTKAGQEIHSQVCPWLSLNEYLQLM
jgi:hypothetical protein